MVSFDSLKNDYIQLFQLLDEWPLISTHSVVHTSDNYPRASRKHCDYDKKQRNNVVVL